MLATSLKRWCAAIVIAAGLVSAGQAVQPKRTTPPARTEMRPVRTVQAPDPMERGAERIATPRAKQQMDRADRFSDDDRIRPTPDAMYAGAPGDDFVDNSSVWGDSCGDCGDCGASCGPA